MWSSFNIRPSLGCGKGVVGSLELSHSSLPSSSVLVHLRPTGWWGKPTVLKAMYAAIPAWYPPSIGDLGLESAIELRQYTGEVRASRTGTFVACRLDTARDCRVGFGIRQALGPKDKSWAGTLVVGAKTNLKDQTPKLFVDLSLGL